jgi:hypothetical protein
MTHAIGFHASASREIQPPRPPNQHEMIEENNGRGTLFLMADLAVKHLLDDQAQRPIGDGR